MFIIFHLLYIWLWVGACRGRHSGSLDNLDHRGFDTLVKSPNYWSFKMKVDMTEQMPNLGHQSNGKNSACRREVPSVISRGCCCWQISMAKHLCSNFVASSRPSPSPGRTPHPDTPRVHHTCQMPVQQTPFPPVLTVSPLLRLLHCLLTCLALTRALRGQHDGVSAK